MKSLIDETLDLCKIEAHLKCYFFMKALQWTNVRINRYANYLDFELAGGIHHVKDFHSWFDARFCYGACANSTDDIRSWLRSTTLP